MKTIETLLDNNWLSVKKITYPERKVPGYVFSHEASCNGHKVAVLPYRYNEKGIRQYLLRNEYTPCWDEEELVISSITGGVIDNDPVKTCVEELEEEAGYRVNPLKLQHLGKCFGVKSADTIYHLFTIDLTDVVQGKPTTTDSQEQESYCYWTEDADIVFAEDPLVSVMFVRLESLFKTGVIK